MGADEYFESGNDSLNAGDSQLESLLDGVTPETDDAGGELAALQAKHTAPIPGGGPLLDQPSAPKVFKEIERAIKRQKRLARNRHEAKKHWDYVVAGAHFSTLEKSEDQSVWKQTFPLDVAGNPEPIPNKIADVKAKMVSQILVDTPLPKPVADGDDDRARMAQDLTRKALRANGTPDACNDAGLFHDALDGLMTAASMFVYVWTHPTGGGWRPKQLQAHPLATDPRNPLVGPKVDPATGQPVTFANPDGTQTVITERTSDPVLRYVTEDGSAFTKDPAAAARQWLPKTCRQLLTPSQVRTHPRTADAFNAHAIDLLLFATLFEAKQRFPVLTALDDAQLKKLTEWKPTTWKEIVPEAMWPKNASDDEAAGVNDDTLLFWYHRFCRVSPDYPDGGEIAVSGGMNGFLLTRDTLREDVQLDDGTTVPVLMHPPVSQFRGLNDVKNGDPNGVCPVSLFGGANDIYAHLFIKILEALDKSLNRNVYIPATSPISREEYMRRDGTPLEILVPEDKPIEETPVTLPPYTIDMLDRIDHAINSLARTNETSNGLDSPYAVSGEAKKVAIMQSKVGLRDIWQNLINGCCYYWLIVAQQWQARYTVPQQVALVGQDSAYKQRWWVGADLIGVKKIALEPGSASMMSPIEKAQWLQQMQGAEWLTKEDAGELARSAMSDDLGLPVNVHEERVNREIADWAEGPPKGWEQDYAANMALKQQYEQQVQQATAELAQSGVQGPQAQQQVMQMVPPPTFKPLYTPFIARPNDDDPFVAKIRASKMSRFMSTVEYSEQPATWRTIYDDAYNAAFYSSGGQTVKQQADAAQASQGAQQAAAQGTPDYQKFVQTIVQRVMSLTETDIAKLVAGGVAGGAGGGQGGQGAAGEGAASEGQNPLEPILGAIGEQQGRAHDAQQAALDRAHQANESALDRKHDLTKEAIKSSSGAHAIALKARMQPPKPAPGPLAQGGSPDGAIPKAPAMPEPGPTSLS